MTHEERVPISSKFIRDEFMWDYMSDVDWKLVINNFEACERILGNRDKFPKADFKYVENKAFELQMFLTENNYIIR